MWFYRRMLRVSWRDKRTDESILKELGTKRELVNFIKKRRLSFVGHACRSECSLMKDIMQGKVEWKKRKGRTSNAIHRQRQKLDRKISVRNIRKHRGQRWLEGDRQRGSAGSQRSTKRPWIVSK